MMKIKYKRRWSKGEMSKTIVIFCIRILALVLAWAVVLKTLSAIFNWGVDLSDVLNFTAAAFGGELLLLAFKRVFAKKGSSDSDSYD